MKILLIFLLLAIPAASATQGNRLGIATNYDKFTDQTLITSTHSIMPVRPGFVLFQAAASVDGKYSPSSIPVEVALVIESHSDQWVFLGQSNVLRVLYNNEERYSLGTMKRISGDVVGGGVIEVLYLETTLAAIDKLAKAEQLEIQVGPLESEIKPAQRAGLREWVNLFRKPARVV